MIAEAIARIEALTLQASNVQLVTHERMPHKLGVRQGTKLEWIETPNPHHAHEFDSLADACEFIRTLKGRDKGAGVTTIFNEDRVSFFYEQDALNKRVTCALSHTDQWNRVMAHGNELLYTPKEAIKLLRVGLSGCGQGIDTLIPLIRKIDFTRKSSGSSTVQHGRESLGKSVEVAVQQADEVPESVRVEVPVFTTGGLRFVNAGVLLAISFDFDQGKIGFQAFGGELDRANEVAQDELRGVIEKYLPEAFVGRGEAKTAH